MNILHDQTWSMSKIKLLENCPLQFYLSYILKLKYVDEDQDTVARDLGSCIHRVLELIYMGLTIKEAYEKAEEELYDTVGAENWHAIITMLPNVRKFNRIMHDRDESNPFSLVEPEMKLAVDRDFKPVDFFSKDAYFRGVVDFIARRGREVTVIDHKKGGAGWLTKYHTPQLSSYLLLDYCCNGGFDIGNAYIYYVEAGDLSRGPSINGDMIMSHTRPWLENKINAAILSVEEEGYFQHKRNNMCKYCDYASLCKSGKRGTCGDLTQHSIDSKDIL